MQDYAGREQAYGQTMTGQLKGFVESVVETSNHADDLFAQRLQAIFSAANWDLNLVMSMLGLDQGMKYYANLPQIMAHQLGYLGVHDATIEGHMDVSSSVDDSLASNTEAGMDGEGKIGWGPISARVKIHAKSSVSTERKRHSDYRAGVKWTVNMQRIAPPEQFMRVIDTVCHFIDKCTDINEVLVDKMSTKLIEDAQKADAAKMLETKTPNNDSGDGDGNGNGGDSGGDNN